MNAKPKTTIKVSSKTVAPNPAKVAARSINSTNVPMPNKVAANRNRVQASVQAAKPKSQIAAAPTPVASNQPISSHSKQSQLIARLRSTTGTTIEEMMILTGWQAHSLRGVISGALRKRLGLNVVTSPSTNSQSRVYRIVDQVSA